MTLVDINETSTRLAARVLALSGCGDCVVATDVATDKAPYFQSPAGPIDVFYACGVLHHIPYPMDILLRARDLLAPGGEIRLMLYTDRAWVLSTGTPVPPVDENVLDNPFHPKFRCSFDSVGFFADWYNEAKIEHRFGDFLELVDYDYITLDETYAAARLRPRS